MNERCKFNVKRRINTRQGIADNVPFFVACVPSAYLLLLQKAWLISGLKPRLVKSVRDGLMVVPPFLRQSATLEANTKMAVIMLTFSFYF